MATTQRASSIVSSVDPPPVIASQKSSKDQKDTNTPTDGLKDDGAYFELPKLTKYNFPVPQEFNPDSFPPSYTDINPFQPLGRPPVDEKSEAPDAGAVNITANDVRPDLRGFDLMKSSIREMTDCKAIFNGLVEGIEKRHSFFPMDEVEKDVYGRTITLRSNADAVLRTCDDLASNCRAFAAACEQKLAHIASGRDSGTILPDSAFEETGRNLLRMSEDMTTHVRTMLANLRDLTKFIQNTKDNGKTSMRKKIWEWLVRAFKAMKRIFLSGAHAIVAPVRLIVGTSVTSAASSLCMTITSGCEENDGIERVLTFLQREIPAAAERAEKHLTAFQAYQNILRGPLGIGAGSGGLGARMDQKEAKEARRDWYSALVKLEEKE